MLQEAVHDSVGCRLKDLSTVDDESWDDLDDPALNTVTSMVYCHKCGGAGHVAPQCPSQLPKGKGKGPSKGKGKGPTTAHKGQPKGGGKGKSRSPMYGS